MILRLIFSLFLVLAQHGTAGAQVADPALVMRTLRLPETIAVMRDEGLAYGQDLRAQFLPEAAGPRWSAEVARIYDAAGMTTRFEAAFARRLGADAAILGPIVDFYGAPRGQTILSLEIAARRMLLDKTAEATAKASVADMKAAHDPRFALLQGFADANDLVEQNVAGAMNANLAFYHGMAAGGMFGRGGMSETDMVSEIWAQEPAVRAETEDWLYPFLALAYGPLSDADMQAYLGFSRTAAGGALNAAMFGAFDEVFGEISQGLGRAAAGVLAGQDL